ncbi:MAG: class I SAM-dependent methyltransferase, partial [Anaerolineae bacterium]|nr:class I SAM-dependent methyltransferase [Anaerolineae bacterium]
MSHLQGEARAAYVQNMFDRIAGRYNLMNRLMTGGQDLRWRRFVVQQAHLPAGGKLLDLATGTGDIGFEALRAVPDATVVGGDFSLGMMRVG